MSEIILRPLPTPKVLIYSGHAYENIAGRRTQIPKNHTKLSMHTSQMT